MSRQRRGFSLIELLVVMSIGGLLLSIAIGTVERAMRIHEETTSQLAEALAMVQLTEQFRHDVHLASSLVLDQPKQLSIRLLDGTVTYSINGHHVERLKQGPDDRRQVEHYQLNDRSEIVFSSLEEPERTVMTVSARTGLQHSPMRVERVVAAVNGMRVAAFDEEINP